MSVSKEVAEGTNSLALSVKHPRLYFRLYNEQLSSKPSSNLRISNKKSSRKMKISIVASVSAFTVTDTRVARDVEEVNTRRYFQLIDMMKHYNPQFDERKQFQYGCNCYILGKLTKSCFVLSFELR